MLKLLKKHSQFIRFLFVGGWNTAFGFAAFILLFYMFPRFHYMIIAVISNIVSITNAYFSYKFFVFKTKGNYLKEYFRFYGVYGVAFLLNLLILPVMVELIHVHPISAQGLAIVITVFISYYGHKHFSFKKG